MSRWYERGCKAVGRRWGPTRDEREEARDKRREKYVTKGKELRKAEGYLRECKIVHGEESKEYRKAQKRYEKAKKLHDISRKAYRHDDFNKTIYFVDMDLEYEDVLLFSVLMTLLSFLVVALTFITLHYAFYPLGFIDILLYVVPAMLLVPTCVLALVSSYPDLLEKKMKAEGIGRAPESINYMTMSMRVRPSLYRAVSFSAKHTEEPMASGLNKVLWDVYTRKKPSLEESFLEFALQWGEWNEDLKRALYAVRSAMLEKTKHGLDAALEKANDIIIRGTKRQVEDFSNSLSTPTTILFAIGVLLPLIIGAMLPMLALGDLDIGGFSADEAVASGGLGIFQIIIIMNVIAPVGAFVYSYKILLNRPGTTSPPEVPQFENRGRTLIVTSVIAILLSIPLILFYEHLGPLMPLPFFWPPMGAISYYCLKPTWEVKKERRIITTMEREFPDALFQLGSRIAEGMAIEVAFHKTGKSMGGTEMGKLLERITTALQINRLPLEHALFGHDGVLTKLPSRTIKASMRTVVEVTKKDPAEAGKTIIQISNFLRDMEEMEHDIRSRLSQSVEMMKGTAMVFAPLVMGVVVSLYFMLYDIFSDISQVDMISPVAFTAVVGVYLVLMCFVITYFTTGIRTRVDPVEFKYELGIILPICIGLFSMAVILGRLTLVG